MQIVYKFRVSFEDHDDVVRFIDIESTASFDDFHKIIQSSIGFDASKEFSFFLSDDIWRVAKKICGSETREEESLKPPHQISLNKHINDPHQRFIYWFDPELEWSFYIELVKIMKAEPSKKYPLLARKEGEAPKQYKLKGKLPGATASLNEYDKMAEMLMASRLMDDLNKVAEDDSETETDDVDLDELDIPEIELPDLEIPKIEKKIAEKPIIKKPISFDLKFDDEELVIDADDFSLLDGEEGEDDEKEEDEDMESDDYGGYGQDDNDDY